MGNILSSLIGGASSLIGGLMNTSSAQAINTQNLQWAQANNPAANPQYLNNLVANAKTAGLNPLSVLGIGGGPGFAAQETDPGQGLMAAGKTIAGIDPYSDELRQNELEKQRVDLANARIAGSNTAQQVARDAMLNDALARYLATHKGVIPEGVQQPTPSTMFNDFGAGTLNEINKAVGDFGSRFGAMFRSSGDYLPDWMRPRRY